MPLLRQGGGAILGPYPKITKSTATAGTGPHSSGVTSVPIPNTQYAGTPTLGAPAGTPNRGLETFPTISRDNPNGLRRGREGRLIGIGAKKAIAAGAPRLGTPGRITPLSMPARSNAGGAVRGKARATQVQTMNKARITAPSTRARKPRSRSRPY